MRNDKEIILNMRKSGMSYREIQQETGVSRATLTSWFKDIEWSRHIKHTNNKIQIGLSKERIIQMNLARKIRLEEYYDKAFIEAQREFEQYKQDPLFHAGLMLYVGEGNKANKNSIRLSNAEFDAHRIFISFAQKYLKIPKDKMRFWLLLYPDLDDVLCKERWCAELGLNETQFHKSHIIKGKETKRRLLFGVGTTIISDTYNKKKLLAWIMFAFEQYRQP